MASKLAAIEDTLIAQCQALLGNRIKLVEYSPPDWDEDYLARVLRNLPGVFVIFDGGHAVNAGGGSVVIDTRWSVVCGSQNKASNKARARGDSTEIGCYEMLETLIPALNNLPVTVGINNEPVGALQFQDWDNQAAIKLDSVGVMLQSARFSMVIDLITSLDGSLLTPFASFHSTFDVGQLPGAPVQDNHVELEQ